MSSQVDQARPAHVGGNKFRSELDGIEEKGKIAARGNPEMNLLGEDMTRKERRAKSQDSS